MTTGTARTMFRDLYQNSPEMRLYGDFILSPRNFLYYNNFPASHPGVVGSFARHDYSGPLDHTFT